MKKTVFKITGKFKDALNAIKWFRKYFGNKTMREMRLTFKFIPESKITFDGISKGEIPYYE